ncbi:MAG TPA: hypothetical protein VIB48_12570 [Acidimicrobiia bacterium]|jgi:hypothetical protein
MVDRQGGTGRGGIPLVTGRVVFERVETGDWQVGGVLAWLDADELVVHAGHPAARLVVVTQVDTVDVGEIDERQWAVSTVGPAAMLAGVERPDVEGLRARVGEVSVPMDAPYLAPLEGMMCDYCDPARSILKCPYHGNPH